MNVGRHLTSISLKLNILMIKTIEWTPDGIVMIDQTKLPTEEVYITCRTYEEIADAIRNMVIRGAPAIGVAAAMGVARGICNLVERSRDSVEPIERFDQAMDEMCATLAATRPTAVNLFWALDRMKDMYAVLRARSSPIETI